MNFIDIHWQVFGDSGMSATGKESTNKQDKNLLLKFTKTGIEFKQIWPKQLRSFNTTDWREV